MTFAWSFNRDRKSQDNLNAKGKLYSTIHHYCTSPKRSQFHHNIKLWSRKTTRPTQSMSRPMSSKRSSPRSPTSAKKAARQRYFLLLCKKNSTQFWSQSAETAKCSDIAFITPRETLDWHVAEAWTEEDIQEYFGVDESTWSQSDMYANQLATQARDEYMTDAGLTRGTCQTQISHLI